MAIRALVVRAPSSFSLHAAPPGPTGELQIRGDQEPTLDRPMPLAIGPPPYELKSIIYNVPDAALPRGA